MSEKLTTLLSNIQWSPKTLITGAITTLLGALLAFSLGWVHNTSATQTMHEAKIAVLDERTVNTEKSVDKIERSQRRIEDKLDRVLEKKR